MWMALCARVCRTRTAAMPGWRVQAGAARGDAAALGAMAWHASPGAHLRRDEVRCSRIRPWLLPCLFHVKPPEPLPGVSVNAVATTPAREHPAWTRAGAGSQVAG